MNYLSCGIHFYRDATISQNKPKKMTKMYDKCAVGDDFLVRASCHIFNKNVGVLAYQ